MRFQALTSWAIRRHHGQPKSYKYIPGQFNAELEYIRTQVMTMGGLVEQQLSDAITAMHNQAAIWRNASSTATSRST
uniref:hypothetical protein n=1 Tax=Enterobacter hormaechei TaxID=158836 RepID=UPI003AAC6713